MSPRDTAMNPNLMTLLEIQDLRSQVRDLETGDEGVEQEHFNIEPSDAIDQLEAKIEDLEGQLDRRILSRYRRIAASLNRVVVPVIEGVCYGCFVSIATARAGEEDPNETLKSCENCGRFIYILS